MLWSLGPSKASSYEDASWGVYDARVDYLTLL